MCIRQLLSQAVQASAPVLRMAVVFSASIALETSAFLTAKVPPKPQHCSTFARGTRSIPRTAFSKVRGPSPSSRFRRPWQLAW